MSRTSCFGISPGNVLARLTPLVRMLFLGGMATSMPVSAAVYATASVYVGNVHPGTYGPATYLASLKQVSSQTEAVDTGEVWQTYTGNSGTGTVETENFFGRASTRTNYQSMTVQADYQLLNRLASRFNGPAVNADFSLNANGVPESFFAVATAQVSDTVAVTAASPIEFLEFSYRLVGTVATVGGLQNTNVGPDNYVSLYGAANFSSEFDGSFDRVVTGRARVVNGSAKYLLIFEAGAGLNTVFSDRPWLDLGRNSSGSVSFTNSLDLRSVIGRAADGTAVPLDSAIGKSGFNYLTSAVPEPGAGLLTGAGLVALMLVVRRRRVST